MNALDITQTILFYIGWVAVGWLLFVVLCGAILWWIVCKAERDEARDVLKRMGEK